MSDLNSWKVSELKEELTGLGIEFDSKLKKHELIKLLEEVTEEAPKKYVVVHDFKDLEDNSYVYFKGDPYPRKGNKKVTEERIQELLSNQNKRKKPLIKEQD